MHLSNSDHWALIQSGIPLGRYPTIKHALDVVRKLHKNPEIKGNYITDMIYDVAVVCKSETVHYTILWSL